MREWIPAWEAMMKMRESELLSGSPDPANAARKKILEALTSGQLRACARYLIQECDDGSVPDYHVRSAKDVKLVPHEDQQQSEFAIFDTTLPLDFFGAQNGWQLKPVSWELGRFLAAKTTKKDGDSSPLATRRYVDGMAINAANLDALMAPLEPPTIAQEAASDGKKKGYKPGGRPIRLIQWQQFWFVLLRLSEDGNLHRSALGDKEHLLQIIERETGHDGLDDASARKAIRAVWKEIMDPDEDREKIVIT